MNRLRRILFEGLALLSALLCVATIALWVRSHWSRDVVYVECQPTSRSYYYSCAVLGNVGTILVDVRQYPEGDSLSGAGRWTALFRSEEADPPSAGASFWEKLGFSLDWTTEAQLIAYEEMPGPKADIFDLNHGQIRLELPDWLFVILFLLLPAWVVTMRRRMRRRLQYNLCRQCGYDLRATSERCPECGTIAAKLRGKA